MFKFKNFKILLLLMLFAFAGQDAWGYKGTWFNFRAKFTATGEGKVYGDFINKENAVNKLHENVTVRHRHDGGGTEDGDTYSGNEPIDLHLFAEASDGWEFVEWRDENNNKLSTSMPCDAQGNATSESTKYGYAIVANFKSKNVCGRNFSSTQGSADGHQEQHNTTYYDNYYNRVDARYVAVFRELESGPVVTAEPLDETLGLASFSPGDNQVGDIVTIATHPSGAKDKGYENKFLGWQHNGEFLRDEQGKIIRDNPYIFEVTEDNAGIYYAVYESGYLFYRIKNYVTKDYFDAISDNVTGNGLAAFKEALSNDFSMEDDGTCKAGSIYQIHTYKNTDGSGRIVYDLEVQNKHTKDYYDLPSIYIRLNQDADKNAWNFSTSNDEGQGARLRVNEEGVQSVSSVLDDRSLWYIEPIDKDLETKENYFSLDPAKLIEVDGKYYTTLRTSWNILFNPEQMTPYVVTEVDEENGTFEMEPIIGNIIPAGTPVIIETSSTDIEANRMVPTLTNAASGAVPEGNFLKVSTKYFPNQDAPVANCKGLIKNANGQLAFGGDALAKVNGNEAYLSVANEVVKIETLPLSEIEQVGVKDRKYIVKDQLVVIHADVDKGMLWCKDQGNKSIAKTEKQDGQIDYMREITKEQEKEWDQSNWVMLQFDQPTPNSNLENLLKTATGKYIEPATIKGSYSDVNNYTITMANQILQLNDGGEPYVKNLYCTANFLPKNLNINGGSGAEGIYHGEPAYYFFMNPKVQEVCEITYAEWDGDNLFIAPLPSANNPTQNDSQIDGAFTVAWTYNCTNQAPSLTKGTPYRFFAVVQRTSSSNYLKDVDRYPSEDIIVYPLNLDPVNNNNVITAIENVANGKTITRVVYYNLMGVESDKPHPGINIVETRYSDGTRTTTKVIR